MDLETIERIVHDLRADSAATKRQRHAQSMARGRSRKREALSRMRNQRVHLQSVLQNALDARSRGHKIDVAHDLKLLETAGDCAGDAAVAPVTVDGATELFEQYVAAVELQNSMHGEIESLQTRIEQYKIFEAALMIDTSLLPDESTASSVPDEEPFFFEPYEPQTAREMIHTMYQDSKQFNALFTNRQVDSYENRCLGWTVQRSVAEKQHLRFHFTKRVVCSSSAATASDMLRETWKTFHTPQLYARLYRTVMISRVIQQVDASTSVILRNSPSSDRTHHVRMVTMVSQVRDYNDKGQRTHSVLTLVVEPPETAQNRNGVMFIRKGYTYITFTEIADGDDDGGGSPMVEITYGGHGDCLNEAHAMYLLIETGAVLVRWEQFVTPQRLVTSQ